MEWTDHWQERISREKITGSVVMQHGLLRLAYYRNRKAAAKLHNVNSVTKSVTSALVGICLEKGLIRSLDTPIADFFPEMTLDDPRKQQITIDHLLTMTPGFDWPEFGKWQAFCPMCYAKHWVRFVLERPMECAPGERMNYNSGASQLLGAIIQRVSGMAADAFAEQHLFRPLGIGDYRWRRDPQGVSVAGFGLSLTADTMAKFGLLYLNNGRWGDRQVLSADWVAESTKPRYLTYPKIGHYARHWWAAPPTETSPGYYFALGLGGQYIIVVPDAALVVTITSELYDQTILPLKLFREHVLPALAATAGLQGAAEPSNGHRSLR